MIIYAMHDDEPDTFVLQTLPEQFVEKLSKIGINSKANEIGEGQFETGDYYSRVFVPTPRMVTNRGSLEISGKNIDSVHIIQKDKILMQDPTPMVWGAMDRFQALIIKVKGKSRGWQQKQSTKAPTK